MMQEVREWSPLEGNLSEGRYSCEGLLDDYEGFRVLIRSDAKSAPMLKLAWEHVLLYQSRDESYCLKWNNLKGDFNFPYPFYLIENSDLMMKFHVDSSGVYEDWAVKHFCIYTSNDCIDVLSVNEPTVENLNE